jgi:hypothetical protein
MASQDLPVPELSRNMRLIGHTDQGRTVRGVSYQKGENRHFRFGLAEYLLHDRENIGQTVLVFTAVEHLDSDNTSLDVCVAAVSPEGLPSIVALR